MTFSQTYLKAITLKDPLLGNTQAVTSALPKPVPGVFANTCLHLQLIGFSFPFRFPPPRPASAVMWLPKFPLQMLFQLAAVSRSWWLAAYQTGMEYRNFTPKKFSSKEFAISFSGFRISITASRPFRQQSKTNSTTHKLVVPNLEGIQIVV